MSEIINKSADHNADIYDFAVYIKLPMVKKITIVHAVRTRLYQHHNAIKKNEVYSPKIYRENWS